MKKAMWPSGVIGIGVAAAMMPSIGAAGVAVGVAVAVALYFGANRSVS